MTRRRQRDRHVTSAPTPAPPKIAPPTPEPELRPPSDAGGAPKPTAGRVAELVSKATAAGATSEDVAAARAELARVLGIGLDLAVDQGDLDQILRLTDRLVKLLPAGRASADPEPAAGGGPGGNDGAGAEPTPAERFRLVSGELGNA